MATVQGYHSYQASPVYGSRHSVRADPVRMEATQIIELLKRRVAFLTGGRDRKGGPLLTFPSHSQSDEFTPQDIITCIKYLISIPNPESLNQGVTVIVDNRQGYYRNLKYLMKIIWQALDHRLSAVYVVERDKNRRLGSFRKEKYEVPFEPHMVTIHKLHQNVDPGQIHDELDGRLHYNHDTWLDNRLEYERFLREVKAVDADLDVQMGQMHELWQQFSHMTPQDLIKQHEHLRNNVLRHPENVIRQGRDLYRKLQIDADTGFTQARVSDNTHYTLDQVVTMNSIKRTVEHLENKLDKITEIWQDKERGVGERMQVSELEMAMKTVVDWILGPAEKLMISQTDIGTSYQTADELRKQHEQLELKCTDTYGTYAELRHKAAFLLNEGHENAADVEAQRNYMDTVCRSYAARLEKRRNLIITSVRYHRLAENLSRLLDELLDLVCSEIVAPDVQSAKDALKTLQEKCEKLNASADETFSESQNLLDQLSLPIKNAFGQDVTPDNRGHVEHVENVTSELQDRKSRCDELSDVRRLKLEQILQLRTCDHDAQRATMWIHELCEVAHNSQKQTMSSVQQAEEERQKLENTARSSYEYGKQLLSASLTLRRSLRMDTAPNAEQTRQLEEAWRKFSEQISQQLTQRNAQRQFERKAEEVLDEINQVMVGISQAANKEITLHDLIKRFSPVKDKTVDDYNATVRMGQDVLNLLAKPVLKIEGGEKRYTLNENQGSMDTVRNKLDLLQQRLYKMEKAWQDQSKGLHLGPTGQVLGPDGRVHTLSNGHLPGQQTPTGSLQRRRSRTQGPQPMVAKRPREDMITVAKAAPVGQQPVTTSYVQSAGAPSHRPPSVASSHSRQNSAASSLNYSQQQTIAPSYAQPQSVAPGYTPGYARQPPAPSPVSDPFKQLEQDLKESNDWIRVRIQQMEPDLMEVGSNLEEAKQLRREHDDLLYKLGLKQKEVTELLARADAQANENRSYQEVYGAMAKSLREAWDDLNNQLEYRKMLLDQSITFHESAVQFSHKMSDAQAQFAQTGLATDVDTARRLLQQHQDMKKSILESSMHTLQEGQSLLDRIRQMGKHADVHNRHATTSACYGIEHLLELLHDRRRHLEEVWATRRIKLEQHLQLLLLDQEVSKVSDWFSQVGNAYADKCELGESVQTAQALQEQHLRFEYQAREIKDTILRLVRTADQLTHSAHYDADAVKSRLQKVDQNSEDFMLKMETRRKDLSLAVSFFFQANTALSKLNEIEVQLNSTDLPRNSQALAEQHSFLSGLITEASTPALHEGRVLLERVRRDDPGVAGVAKQYELLQERVKALQDKCLARYEAGERSQAFNQFQDQCRQMSQWLSQIGQGTLVNHGDLGSNLAAARDFLEVHERLHDDLMEKSDDIKALSATADQLSKSGDQFADSASESVNQLKEQWNQVADFTESRTKLSLAYIAFHKKAQQLAVQMDALEQYLKIEKVDPTQISDESVKHKETKFNEMSTEFKQMEQSGHKFIKDANQNKSDERLDVRRAVHVVETIISQFSERQYMVSEYYEHWKVHVVSGKQFKTQWHQFIQDARKTIDQVQKTEKELFVPYISGYLGKTEDEAKKMQKKLDEFMPKAKKAQDDIEKHLKTAEMLSLKGDTHGQKDQIVNELVKVHTRFQARITEYQVLLNMTIQFFKNLHQMDKLIEDTEKEYKKAELPKDVTQAQIVLKEHKAKKNQLEGMLNASHEQGEEIVVRVRQQDSEAIAKDEVQKVLKMTEDRRSQWEHSWEERRARLEQNLQVCQFYFDLKQLHNELDELHRQLNARKGNYGSSLSSVRMMSQAFKNFELTITTIETKIKQFSGTADTMIRDNHYDSRRIRHEVDEVERKWAAFLASIGDYRSSLDKSEKIFEMMDQCEATINDASQFLLQIGTKASTCATSEDALDLINRLEQYKSQFANKQNGRLAEMDKYAVMLWGPVNGPEKMQHIVDKNQDILNSYLKAVDELGVLRDNLLKKEQILAQLKLEAELHAPPVPNWVIQLQDATVSEGQRFTFECKYECATVPEITWFKDGVELKSADYVIGCRDGHCTLTIEETFADDSAQYVCKAKSVAGASETRASLKVRGVKKPYFTEPLRDQVVAEGAGVRLSASFDGKPEPSISWLRNNNPIQSSAVFQISVSGNTTILDINGVYPEDMGTYTVVARNMAGETRTSCNLRVEGIAPTQAGRSMAKPGQAPVIKMGLRSQEVKEGNRAKLECTVTAHPPPTVTWLHNDQVVQEAQDFQIFVEGENFSLVIRETYLEDSGEYKITIKNDLGTAESTCTLTIIPAMDTTDSRKSSEVSPPRFINLLKDIETLEGDRVQFDCTVIGNPAPMVKWYRGKMEITSSLDFQLSSVRERHTLVIPEVFKEDAGNFMVKATNSAGEAKCFASLIVKQLSDKHIMKTRLIEEAHTVVHKHIAGHSPPEFKALFKDMRVRPGEPCKLEVKVVGTPKPKVSWLFNNDPVVSPDYQISSTGDFYTLYIPEVFDEDAGRFSVVCENDVGKATCSALLVVVDEQSAAMNADIASPPPTPVVKSQPFTLPDPRRGPTVVKYREAPPPQPLQKMHAPPPPPVQAFQPELLRKQEAPAPVAKAPVAPPPTAPKPVYQSQMPMQQQPKQVALQMEKPVKPLFKEPLKNVTVEEGERAVIEGWVSAKPEPVIKWYKNEIEITNKADYEITYKNGRTMLTIPEVFAEDSGTYVCVSTNEAGTCRSTAVLQVKPAAVPPQFRERLTTKEAREGESVRFSVRVSGNPPPEVTWYREDSQIVSSRDFEIQQDGDLHMLYIPEVFYEDSGKFSVRAVNRAGQTTCTAELIVEGKRLKRAPAAPPAPPLAPSPRQLETAPVFQIKLTNQPCVAGQTAHFECRVAANPPPEILWTRRGHPLVDKARYQSTYDQYSGVTTLTILNLCEEDEGEYTCTAINNTGEASTSATLLGPDRYQDWLRSQDAGTEKDRPSDLVSELESKMAAASPTIPTAMAPPPSRSPAFYRPMSEKMIDSRMEHQPTMQQPLVPEPGFKVSSFEQRLIDEIDYREGKVAPEHHVTDDEAFVDTGSAVAPIFEQRLKNYQLMEGSDATFVAKVSGSPLPHVTWFHNGRLIRPSNRYEMKMTRDGYVTLRVRLAFPEDAGHYTCCATNIMGRDTCSAELYIEGLGAIDDTSYVSAESLKRLTRSPGSGSRRGSQEPGGVSEKYYRPIFRKIPADQEIAEGKMCRFDSIVTGRPMPDIVWYRDDVQVHDDTNHKIVVNEDGFHSLIIYATQKWDAGLYTCIARNRGGEDRFQVTLNITARQAHEPPRFVERLTNQNVKEGEPFEFVAEASGYPPPMMSWQKDGRHIDRDPRFVIRTERGRSSLSCERADARDTAWFQCTAASVAGTATNRAKLNVQIDPKKPEPERKLFIPKRSTPTPTPIEPARASPDMRRPRDTVDAVPRARQQPAVRPSTQQLIQQGAYPQPADDEMFKKENPRPPRFVTTLKPQTKLKETEPAHFECKLVPIGDPDMVVEWFKDGVILKHGSRFMPVNDFGYVALDILWTYPEDSGTYTCRATNKYGTASTEAHIKCYGKESVIYDSQLPEGDESVQHLHLMEEQIRRENLRKERIEEGPEPSPPVFDLMPEMQQVEEGDTAKFMCKVSGHPRPRLTWWVNGTIIVNGHRFKLRYDGMINVLEIPKVREYDSGTIRVVAKNPLGEAECSTTLVVIPHEDWRSRLKQAPRSTVGIELERQGRTELRSVELDNALKRPRTTVTELRAFERSAQERAQAYRDEEVKDAYNTINLQHATMHTTNKYEELRMHEPNLRIQTEAHIERAKHMVGMESEHKRDTDIPRIPRTGKTEEAPSFGRPLMNVKAKEGKAVKLEVNFSGFPYPDVQWFREGLEIQPSNDFRITTLNNKSFLLIPEVFIEDAGLFSVRATNKFGMVECKAVLEVTPDPNKPRDLSPEFKVQMRDLTVRVGEPATFDVSITGHPKPDVYWAKDGKRLYESKRWKFIVEQDHYTLLIYEVREEDRGVYECIVVNKLGKATCSAKLNAEGKSPAKAHVPTPGQQQAPQLIMPLKDAQVNEGESVTMQCKILAVPEPVVQWYYNNQIIKPSKYFQMYTENGVHTLHIAGAFPEDEGIYKCTARNQAGEVTCIAHLKVIAMVSEPDTEAFKAMEAPKFTKPINAQEVQPGHAAHFVVEVAGSPMPEITWYREGHQILHSEDFQIIQEENKCILYIKEAFPEDSGIFTCRSTNPAGVAECSAELLVEGERREVSEKTIQMKTEKSTKEIKVVQTQQSGEPSLHDGNDTLALPGSKQTKYEPDVIASLIEANKGEPLFIQPLRSIERKAGMAACFECCIQGKPTPRVLWYYNDEQLTDDPQLYEIRSSSRSDGELHTLVVKETYNDVSGEYSARATNSRGFASSVAKLTVQAQREVVATSIQVTQTKQEISEDSTDLTIREFKTSATKIKTFHAERPVVKITSLESKVHEKFDIVSSPTKPRSSPLITDIKSEENVSDKESEKQDTEYIEVLPENEYIDVLPEPRDNSESEQNAEVEHTYIEVLPGTPIETQSYVTPSLTETKPKEEEFVKVVSSGPKKTEIEFEELDFSSLQQRRHSKPKPSTDEDEVIEKPKSKRNWRSSLAKFYDVMEDEIPAGPQSPRKSTDDLDSSATLTQQEETGDADVFEDAAPKISEQTDDKDSFVIVDSPGKDFLTDDETGVSFNDEKPPHVEESTQFAFANEGEPVGFETANEGEPDELQEEYEPLNKTQEKIDLDDFDLESKGEIQTENDKNEEDLDEASVGSNTDDEYEMLNKDALEIEDDERFERLTPAHSMDRLESIHEEEEEDVEDEQTVEEIPKETLPVEANDSYSIYVNSGDSYKPQLSVDEYTPLQSEASVGGAQTKTSSVTLDFAPMPEAKQEPKETQQHITDRLIVEPVPLDVSGDETDPVLDTSEPKVQTMDVVLKPEDQVFTIKPEHVPPEIDHDALMRFSQEVDKTVKTEEIETYDEVTLETKVTEVKTVRMSLTEFGAVEIEEKTEVQTDTGLTESRKVTEREETVLTKRTSDGFELTPLTQSATTFSALQPVQGAAALTSASAPSINVLVDDDNLEEARPNDEPSSIHIPEIKIQSEEPYKEQVSPVSQSNTQFASPGISVSDKRSSVSPATAPLPTETALFSADGFPIYIAVTAYEPESDEVMSLHEGEKLEVLDNSRDDWWLVKKVFDKRRGLVPGQYLRENKEYQHLVDQQLNKIIDSLPYDTDESFIGEPKAPEIISPIKPQHVTDGSPAMFECVITGNPKPLIGWFHECNVVEQSPDFSQFYDEDNLCSLVMKETYPEDTGRYTVVAKNKFGTATCAADLLVVAPETKAQEEGITPAIVTKPKAQVVDEGETVSFTCKLMASPQPQIDWQRENVTIEASEHFTIETSQDVHMYTTTLTVHKVTLKDAGKFTFLAKNDLGEVKVTVSLVVREVKQKMDLRSQLKKKEVKKTEKKTAVVEEKLEDQVVKEGERACFECCIVGNPQPSVTWYFQGKPISENEIYKIQEHDDRFSLIIPECFPEDSGEYRACGDNGECVVESTATLTVLEIFAEESATLSVPQEKPQP